MPDPLNVFEHQCFRLRRSDGTRLEKSFREILTEPDDAYALDYPQEFYNVAALNLLAYLAQVAFEPATTAELAARLAGPMAESEFEEKVAPLRARFALTGDGPRFMQGPPPPAAKKPAPLDKAVFLSFEKPGKTQNDKRFLHRIDPDWAVSPEQAALLLFARNTFYEGQGGGGPDPYYKGVNGDTPVRTVVTIPAGEAVGGDVIHLRQTLWLNVLSREAQRGPGMTGAYAEPGEGYDDLFWEAPPR